MDNHYLIADVGGTNIRFGIASSKYKNYNCLQTYKCNKFPTILEAIQTYLKTIPQDKQPKNGVMAVAAAVGTDIINMTNHSWSFSTKEVVKELGFNNLKIINDFEAQAYAVEYLSSEDAIQIKGAKNTQDNGRKVILGPGTGMGTALLMRNKGWDVISSECGHTVIGSYNEIEQGIFNYIRKTKNLEPYAEAFLSGQGIKNIYEGLCSLLGEKFEPKLLPKDIVEVALTSNDKNNVFTKTLDVFFDILGTYASNVALIYMPYNGIYLSGGILPKVLSHFQGSNFVKRFNDRSLATIRDITEDVPIYLIVKENPAMLGLSRKVIEEGFFN